MIKGRLSSISGTHFKTGSIFGIGDNLELNIKIIITKPEDMKVDFDLHGEDVVLISESQYEKLVVQDVVIGE